MFLGIIDYFGLIVPLIDGFMGKGPHRVVFGAAITDILYHLLGFVRSETPQVRVGVQLGIGFLIQDVSQENVRGGHVLELLHFGLVVT